MALSWNEIKERAVKFSHDWADAFNEEADAQNFLIDFFNVFGISNRRVSTFEYRVKKPGDQDGYIDLFWKGTIIIEMKSRGRNLDKAFEQAKDYLFGIKQAELPRYILVCDFANFWLYDLEEKTQNNFHLKDFVNHLQLFGFIAGYKKQVYKEQDPVNVKAAYLMGKLHDALKEAGYSGHELEKFLVRVLFCLFADDSSIFEPNLFHEYIENKTNEDGSDLGLHLAQIFQVLNTPPEKRLKTLDESLSAFPYINGKLFEEQLSFASFNRIMRLSLLECCTLDWSQISPAIFGSMFQSVMNVKQRRNLGAHYTSEKNILKLIKPLFLDNLWKEFHTIKSNAHKLKLFHQKIASLRFLDPACGCGNFLVITYRELRFLELEILKILQKGQRVFNIETLMQCNVDKFYGIEYEEFPAQIAQVALWLMDHQMNMIFFQEFGEYAPRIPLEKSATIVHSNALKIDWNSLLSPEKTVTIYADKLNFIEAEFSVNEPILHYKTANVFTQKAEKLEKFPTDAQTGKISFDYIFGNPPFIGKHLQNDAQKSDMAEMFGTVKGAGVLDYVTAWYFKAAQYLQMQKGEDVKSRVAFVSTNSISQGEQAGVLWYELFNRYHVKIHFAHRTFKWSNEGKNNAAVHVVIIGFSNFDIPEKVIFEYDTVKGDPHPLTVKNINPYLVEGKDFVIHSAKKPISEVPEMYKGSQPTDNGFLLFTDTEKTELIKIEPQSAKFLLPFISAREFLHNQKRWCLWLVDAKPIELKNCPEILKRLEEVRRFRLKSAKPATQKWAKFPGLFTENRQPKVDYVLIPRHSSENRNYIPFGFFTPMSIVADSCNSIPGATLYHFGVLSSIMHLAWIKTICGRLESRFRYSNDIVYNNFPWPENPTDKQKQAIEKAAQKVLEERAKFPESSLADLYNPLTMPPALVKAHNELDKEVDLAYRSQPFPNETRRIEFLFELYDKYTFGFLNVLQLKHYGKKQANTSNHRL